MARARKEMDTLVLFDIGRVLVNVDRAVFHARLARTTGLTPSEIEKRLEDTGYAESLDCGRRDTFHATLRRALPLPANLADNYLEHAYLAHHVGNNAPVVELKRRLLRTIPVGLLSNSHRIVRSYIEGRWPGTLETSGPSMFSDECGDLKPHREIYHNINSAARRIILIDDVPDNLLYPVTQLGWHGIRYSEFFPHAPVPDALRTHARYSEARNAAELEVRLREAGVDF